MSSGGLSNVVSQVGQQGGFGGVMQPAPSVAQPQMNWQTGQAVAQPAVAANPTGWGRPTFSTDPNSVSASQRWWMGKEGNAATALENQKAQTAFNTTNPAPVRSNFADNASYNAAVAAAPKFTPMTNQQALDQTLRDQIKGGMGNYGNMVNYANQAGISQSDIQRAIGGGNDVYTYMNRPNYQQYSPNGQFNQPIYQSNYQNYNTGNAMGVSQYGQGTSNPYGIGLDLASTPFNPYTNGYQTTPFSAPQAQTYYPQVPQSNYGPSQAIVGRSSQMRGTPNVARRAEGGIASLMDDVE